MKSLNCFAVAGIATLLASGSAQAAIVNPSFETPGLAGWSTVGTAVAADGTIGVSPTHGTFHALASSDAGAASIPTIESAVGLSPGTLAFLNFVNSVASPFEGSAIYQTFVAAAGDTLAFDMDFLTNELSSGFDVAYGMVINSLGSPIAVGAITSIGGAPPIPFGFTAHSGYLSSFPFTFPSAGTFTLAFIALDGDDSAADAGLLVDNIIYTPAGPPPAVPEPGSMALALVGLAGLGVRQLRQRRKAIAS
jgi:MYXO-CTERM domain-containing protein